MPHRTSHILSGQYNIHFGAHVPGSCLELGCAFPGFRNEHPLPPACQLTCLSRAYFRFSGARARSARAGARAAPGARERGALAATRRLRGRRQASPRRASRRRARTRQTDRQTDSDRAAGRHGSRGARARAGARFKVRYTNSAARAPAFARAPRARRVRATPARALRGGGPLSGRAPAAPAR